MHLSIVCPVAQPWRAHFDAAATLKRRSTKECATTLMLVTAKPAANPVRHVWRHPRSRERPPPSATRRSRRRGTDRPAQRPIGNPLHILLRAARERLPSYRSSSPSAATAANTVRLQREVIVNGGGVDVVLAGARPRVTRTSVEIAAMRALAHQYWDGVERDRDLDLVDVLVTDPHVRHSVADSQTLRREQVNKKSHGPGAAARRPDIHR